MGDPRQSPLLGLRLLERSGMFNHVGAPGRPTMEPATKTAVEQGSRRFWVYGPGLGGVPPFAENAVCVVPQMIALDGGTQQALRGVGLPV